MRRVLSILTLILFLTTPVVAAELPAASWDKLPRWRGFNLLEKFMVHNNQPFVEKDFEMIRDLGFNFVRLPMDYRCWIVDGDWEKFDEKTLAEIDQAVAWGQQYDIHVNLNFHRAPGYTVAYPQEKTSLWTDVETQRVCAKHWAMFAKRYKGISNARLSFNLFNEPANVDADVYAKAVAVIVAAIRKEDPDRLIISDGLEWGGKPFPGAKAMQLALATRGYAPIELTHYKADWMGGSDTFPVPTWPTLMGNGMVYGSWKKEWHEPMTIEGPFPKETTLVIRVHQVSTKAEFYVEADDKDVFTKTFEPGEGEGEWTKVVHDWGCYQNIYDKNYTAVIPAGTKTVKIGIREGDWMKLTYMTLSPQSEKPIGVEMLPAWGEPITKFTYDAARRTLDSSTKKDRQWLRTAQIEPWLAVQKTGVGVMVGEFGAYNKTPHDVTLCWMEDNLKNWQEVGWGWALWNFRGAFGIMDSGRADVEYEDFHGHKLDRKMLELLKRN